MDGLSRSRSGNSVDIAGTRARRPTTLGSVDTQVNRIGGAMALVVARPSSDAPDGDLDFWLSRPVAERVAAIAPELLEACMRHPDSRRAANPNNYDWPSDGWLDDQRAIGIDGTLLSSLV